MLLTAATNDGMTNCFCEMLVSMFSFVGPVGETGFGYLKGSGDIADSA
jgi:hypothetical protein